MAALQIALERLNTQTGRVIPIFRKLSAHECRNWNRSRYEGLDIAEQETWQTLELWTQLLREVGTVPGLPADQVKQPLAFFLAVILENVEAQCFQRGNNSMKLLILLMQVMLTTCMLRSCPVRC